MGNTEAREGQTFPEPCWISSELWASRPQLRLFSVISEILSASQWWSEDKGEHVHSGEGAGIDEATY